jgi:hypothetical protein
MRTSHAVIPFMTDKKNKIRLIGRREFVDIPALNIKNLEAKIDTGAFTSSVHCENIIVTYEDMKHVLYVSMGGEGDAVYRFEEFGQKKIKNSFGEMEERYVVKTVVHVGKKKIRSTISLSNRDNMRYPVLIGRRLIKGKFLIDVSNIHTGGISLKQVVKSLQDKI